MHPRTPATVALRTITFARRRSRLAERIDQLRGLRTLDRDLCPVVGTLRHRDALPRVRPHPVEVLAPPARIDADEQPLRGKAVDDDVVDHAALLVAEGAVLRLPVVALGEIVGGQSLRGLQGARAFQRDLPHVRHVEHANGAPHRPMLLEHSLVLDRHVEPRELHHPRGGGEVGVVEWSAQSHGSSSGAANLASGAGARKRGAGDAWTKGSSPGARRSRARTEALAYPGAPRTTVAPLRPRPVRYTRNTHEARLDRLSYPLR